MFSASNFPFAFSVLGGDAASALTAVCPVVVKAQDCILSGIRILQPSPLQDHCAAKQPASDPMVTIT
jgi:hypothetical protein